MLITTDASIFEIKPKEVVFPESCNDLINIVRDLLLKKQSFTMRAGGTSIAGQAIGSGVLIDVSKYLNNILSFSKINKEVVVEPGVIQDDLNDYLRSYNLKFAPDTSTSNRAMIGGMIGNNSCGVYSAYYGTTRDHVKSVEILLSDGSLVTFGEVNTSELKEKLILNTLEGDIYRYIFNTLSQNQSEILDAFPDKSLIRRNTGYAIDELIRKYQPFNSNGKRFSLAPLICGSEGTLGVIVSATLSLVEMPKHKSLIVAQFTTEEQALRVVQGLMKFKPVAVEFIDKPTLEASKGNTQQKNNRTWIKGDPGAVLVIEFFAELQDDLTRVVMNSQKWLKSKDAYDYSEICKEGQKKVWEIRKAGLGLLMGRVGSRKALAVIEDAAIPLNKLYQYYLDIKILMKSYGVEAVYYGHASVGLIHIRPELDLSIDKDKEKMTRIAQDVSKMVKKYKGSLSGEHGDGRIRSPYLKDYFGPKVYKYLTDLKSVFDPDNLLNPKVIISNDSITENLRPVKALNNGFITGFDWSNDISFFSASEKCNGAGVCRRSAGSGIMCPSYKATRDEIFSTRGRANLLRRALGSSNPLKSLKNKSIEKSLDFCLACKACKVECPASVDMSKMKSEYLYQTGVCSNWYVQYYVKNMSRILNFWSHHVRTFNFIQNNRFFRRIAGIQRRLPELQGESITNWWTLNNNPKIQKNCITVWVVCDLFTEYYDVKIGKKLVSFLKMCNVNVKLLPSRSYIVALISQGLLSEAKKELEGLRFKLTQVGVDDKIVGVEPSEILLWRDEAKELIKGNLPKILLFEELLLELKMHNLLPSFKSVRKKVWIHVHCHQQALSDIATIKQSLMLIPNIDLEFINSGCCGMAGDFGYLKNETSKKIAEQSLGSHLKKIEENDIVIATGSSCRKQFIDIFNTKSMHMSEIFYLAVE